MKNAEHRLDFTHIKDTISSYALCVFHESIFGKFDHVIIR